MLRDVGYAEDDLVNRGELVLRAVEPRGAIFYSTFSA
jgi:hypothetical protein